MLTQKSSLFSDKKIEALIDKAVSNGFKLNPLSYTGCALGAMVFALDLKPKSHQSIVDLAFPEHISKIIGRSKSWCLGVGSGFLGNPVNGHDATMLKKSDSDIETEELNDGIRFGLKMREKYKITETF